MRAARRPPPRRASSTSCSCLISPLPVLKADPRMSPWLDASSSTSCLCLQLVLLPGEILINKAWVHLWGLQLYSAFLTSGPSKPFTILPNIHTFRHWRRCQPRKATASSSGAVKVRRLAQGHLDTQKLGGAGDRTSNLPVTSQPTLSHAAPTLRETEREKNY